jgi:hypothetical protein
MNSMPKLIEAYELGMADARKGLPLRYDIDHMDWPWDQQMVYEMGRMSVFEKAAKRLENRERNRKRCEGCIPAGHIYRR